MSQDTGSSGPSIEEDDEISLLDLLQVVVENLRCWCLGRWLRAWWLLE